MPCKARHRPMIVPKPYRAFLFPAMRKRRRNDGYLIILLYLCKQKIRIKNDSLYSRETECG